MLSRAHVLFDGRWIGAHGIGRFSAELASRISMRPLQIGSTRPSSPVDPFILSAVLSLAKSRLFLSPGYNGPWTSKLPYIVTLHDLNLLYVRENSSVAKRAYFNTVVRRIARSAAHVLTVSEFSRGQIMEWAGLPSEAVSNVGNGVSERYSASGPRHSPGFPYLFFVGNRKPHKNVTRLLLAFGASRVHGDVKLLMSGGPDEATRRVARSQGIEDSVVFAGDIMETDLPSFYRGALALVFPSTYEGFGLPAIEAMACGTPVLTSCTGALKEVSSDAALFVDPLDVDSIANGIQRVVYDVATRNTLRERGVRRAAAFSWETTATRVLQVVDGVSGEA